MTDPDDLAAVREVYDASAETYARVVGTQLSAAFEGPVDQALLAAFVELVGPSAGRIADVGCGPGRIAAFLAPHGLDVVGVDVSPEMLAVARAAHPDLRFEEGTLTSLPFDDRSFGAAVCWYSIIHTRPEELPNVFGELARVLEPSGELLVGFQAGDGERVERVDAYGTGMTLPSYRHSPNAVADALDTAGFHVHTRARREPALAHESTPQAFVLARRRP